MVIFFVLDVADWTVVLINSFSFLIVHSRFFFLIITLYLFAIDCRTNLYKQKARGMTGRYLDVIYWRSLAN